MKMASFKKGALCALALTALAVLVLNLLHVGGIQRDQRGSALDEAGQGVPPTTPAQAHTVVASKGDGSPATNSVGPSTTPPGSGISAGPTPTSSTATNDISETVLRQIAALQAEAEKRTPVQRKISSQLLAANRMRRGEPIADGVTSLIVDLDRDDLGRVLVDIKAEVTKELLEKIESFGGKVVNSYSQNRAIRAGVPLDQMEALASRSEVVFIKPAARARTHVGSVTSEGDVAHKANLARNTFGINGAGIKVGVLSDSVDYLTQSQGRSDLGTVTVLTGQNGIESGSTGEGTAMLEIIHDLAPGSALYFATAMDGAASFADNIRQLRRQGCDIIVDDVGYFDQSPFQDDIIAQAVNDVTASGALYFSSAGNSGNLAHGNSGTWEGDFVDGGDASALGLSITGRLHKFGSLTYNTLSTVNSSGVVVHWADPLDDSSNNYDLYILNSTGTQVLAKSDDIQNGNLDPREEIYWSSAPSLVRIVVVKKSGSSRFLHVDTLRGSLSIATRGETHGQSCAKDAFCVAAVSARNYTGPFSGGTKNPVETFSSDGPRRIFFKADGTPITPGNFSSTGGEVRQKPDIAAADGVMTSVPGFKPFYGTSAAAPHAAAVAALLKSYNPGLTSAQIRDILTRSALNIETAGVDVTSGYGIVMALETLQAAQAPVGPTISNFSPSSAAVGSSVTIQGTKFNSVSAVKFNGVSSTYTVNSATQISATVPAGAATGRITVVTPSGTATSASDFVVLALPGITGFSPSSANVGSSVVISGTNFTGATSVRFNGISSVYTVNSSSRITAIVPANATTGRISVTTPGGTATSAGAFTVTALPVITGFSPASAAAGMSVVLTGVNFNGVTSVKFNGVSATFTINSSTQINATVPSGATSGRISVVSSAGSASSDAAFTVVPTPSISSFAPAIGPVGTEVTITGLNLSGATVVRFNGVAANNFVIRSSTSIVAVVPPSATSGTISLTTSGGTAASPAAFSVLSKPANDDFANAQSISGNSGSAAGSNVAATKEGGEPNHADNEGGHSVWYKWTAPASGTYTFDTAGSDFNTLLAVYTGNTLSNLTVVAQNDDTSVTNYTSSVTFVAASGTTYRIAADGHTYGPGGVTNGIYGSVVLRWAAASSAPVITSFTPTSAAPGAPVVISGVGFSGATSVQFGGVSATFNVASSTQISAVVPAQAVSGYLTVVTPNGTAVSVASFTVQGVVNNDNFANAQVISGASGMVSGNTGLAGKESGEPLHGGNTGGHSVWYRWTAPSTGLWTFDTHGSSFDTLLSVYTGSSLTTLKQVASNDDAGGYSTSLVNFSAISGTTYQIGLDGYNGAKGSLVLNWVSASAATLPSITSFSPTQGAVGASVVIKGQNFASTTGVRFSGVNAGFAINSDSQITATVPNGAGSGPITVMTPGGQVDSTNAFVVATGPANDLFANAQMLSGAVTFTTGTTVGSTKESGEPDHAGDAGGHSIWYRWTAPTNGTYVIDLSGSSFDTILGIYNGSSVGALNLVASTDDGGVGVASKTSFNAIGGITYSIAVDGYAGDSGFVALRLMPAWPVTVIYTTGFEYSEGYSTNLDLVGQRGWRKSGSGGNGILDDAFIGRGQQAFIGFFPPDIDDEGLFVWPTLNYRPTPGTLPIVRFSTDFAIIDSENGSYDDFEWHVYDSNNNRLLRIDFDNSCLGTYYSHQFGTPYVDTGVTFTNGYIYHLQIIMDFGRNRWAALLDDTPLVTEQPITANGSVPTIADIDAAWLLQDTNFPGDNVMLFDNYKVTAEPAQTPGILMPPQSQMAAAGDSVVFAIIASGPDPLSYQWYFNGTPLEDQTLPVLMIENVNAGQVGQYTCTVSNLTGSVTSSAATLSLTGSQPVAVDHFAWSTVPSPQTANGPFAVTLTAMDADNAVVAGFNGTVAIAGAATIGDRLFNDDFEDGNLSDWTSEGGAYVRTIDANGAAGTTQSLTLIGGDGTNTYNGISHSFAAIRPDRINFYVRSSTATGSSGYFVVGSTKYRTNSVVHFFLHEDGTMGLTDANGTNFYTMSYSANQWYKIGLALNWTDKTVDYYVNDSLVQSGVGFCNPAIDSISALNLYNFDNCQAWWDQIEFLQNTASGLVSLSVTNSGLFVDGVWTGSIAVLQKATNVVLSATDNAGHFGYSNPFDVKDLETGNLVVNGGFEAGNFTGWTMVYGSVVTNSSYVHSGKYGVKIGPSERTYPISQSLATIPGRSYHLSFWVYNAGGPTNEFSASWNGTNLYRGVNLQAFGWTNMQFQVIATSSSSALQFNFRHVPSYFGLDDVCVTEIQSSVASLSVTASPTGAGNVSGGGAYPVGSSQIITAIPNSGWRFVSWQDGNTENPRTVTIPGNGAIYTAQFATVQAPQITSQPASITNAAGTIASFSVTASGTMPLVYQWYKNTLRLSNGGNVSGVNEPILTVSNVQSNDAGSYSVVITNSVGSITSQVAALTVSVPAKISVGPVSNSFGSIQVGSAVDRTFWVTNTGGGVLTGNATVSSPFSIVSGGTYTVMAGQTQPVVVRYSPSIAGTHTAIVSFSGGVGASATVSGSAYVVSLSRYSFTNSNRITINDASGSGVAAAASPYPSPIQISGLSGVVSNLTVTLRGFTHSYPHDVGVLLVGPKGQKIVLLADSGGQGIADITLTLDDAAPSKLTEYPSGAISSGQYKPSNCGSGDTVFAAGAPAGPYADTLRICNGSTVNGTWSLYVQDDSNGDSGAIVNGWSLSFDLIPSVEVPKITEQPLSQTVIIGNNAAFSVVASGVTLNYQWKRNGIALVDDGRISGATTPKLTIADVLEQDAGTFTVVVSNTAGSVPSLPAVLTVPSLKTPVLGVPRRLANGQYELTISGAQGSNYVIQLSSDLITWKALNTITLTNRTSKTLDQSVGISNRFYRVLLP